MSTSRSATKANPRGLKRTRDRVVTDNFCWPPQLRTKFVQRAKKEGKSKSALFREAITAFLGEENADLA